MDKPTVRETEWEKIEKDLGVFLWGRKVTDDAMKNAKQIMPFIKELLSSSHTRILESECMQDEPDTAMFGSKRWCEIKYANQLRSQIREVIQS